MANRTIGRQALPAADFIEEVICDPLNGTPARVAADGALVMGQGMASVLNITAPALIKAVPGRVCRVAVLVAGSAPGSVNDCATAGAAAAANQVAAIPAVVQIVAVDWPMLVGIVVVPGAGQTLSVSYL